VRGRRTLEELSSRLWSTSAVATADPAKLPTNVGLRNGSFVLRRATAVDVNSILVTTVWSTIAMRTRAHLPPLHTSTPFCCWRGPHACLHPYTEPEPVPQIFTTTTTTTTCQNHDHNHQGYAPHCPTPLSQPPSPFPPSCLLVPPKHHIMLSLRMSSHWFGYVQALRYPHGCPHLRSPAD